MEIKGKNITVLGLGKTGKALAHFLLGRGARVTVTDSSQEESVKEAARQLRHKGVNVETGRHSAGCFEKADLVVLSPGIPHTIEPVEMARRAGVRVTGEIELAGRFINTPIVAVTGTNGKSTVTRLIGLMLEKSGKTVFVGGNLGTPLISYADSDQKADVAVAEISSFQLDTAETFRPAVGVLLNIAADHLDRYDGLREYGAAKARLFSRQDSGDTAVLNAADPLVMELTCSIRSRRCLFNSGAGPDCRAWIDDGNIGLCLPEGKSLEIRGQDMFLPGRHNLENAAAAALAASAAGAGPEGIVAAVKQFCPDPHRMQQVGCFGGVNFYDDSKATNVSAAARALEAFEGPVVLILGGRSKQGGYAGLAGPVARKAKALVLMGEAAEEIQDELGQIVETRRVWSMDEAVAKAGCLAGPGGTVLLSPACSSFDMYDNYARRGNDFQRAARKFGKCGDGKRCGKKRVDARQG